MYKLLIFLLLCILSNICLGQPGTDIATDQPVDQPTEQSTELSTEQSSELPSENATELSTEQPTEQSTELSTEQSSELPSENATELSTEQPTEQPVEQPTEQPVEQPTEQPVEQPTEQPVEQPTEQPVEQPTEQPVEQPTEQPVEQPTEQSSELPSENATELSTEQPTEQSTELSTEQSSELPSEESTEQSTELESNTDQGKCGKGTSRFGGYCACWSGAYGKNCSMDDAVPRTIIPTPWKMVNLGDYLDLDEDNMRDINFEADYTGHVCSNFVQLEFLETKAPPILEEALFLNGSLSITVSHPVVNGRAESILFLNKDDTSLNDCFYPVSDYITKEVSGCKDLWRFDIPWRLASKCNWEIYREESHIVYCGKIILQHTEWMSNIKEWRFTQSMLRIKVRFQLFVKVQVGQVVVNKPEVIAAITKQIVNINCYDVLPAIIELTTLTNWPYKLDSDFVLSQTPSGKVASFELDYTDCSGVENSGCRQKWRTALNFTENTCTLDGDYQLSFNRSCFSEFKECPLSDEDRKVVIDYSLTSENFCAEVSLDISLTASIKIYEDRDFSKERSLFMAGQRAYFLVQIDSRLNDEKNVIDFSEVKVVTIMVRGENSDIPTLICENGSPSNDSIKANTLIHPRPSSTEIGFSFDFTSDLTTKLLRPNGRKSIFTSVELEVNYQSKKRYVLELEATNSEKSTFTTEVGVDTDSPGKGHQDDSGFTILAASVLLLIASLFF